MLLVLGIAVPLRGDLTGASFSPRRCWRTGWNSFLQSVEVDYNNELTEYDKRGRSDLLYYEVSKLTRTGKKLAAKSAAINDENGELISEIEEVK